jgi:hypothetical protein
MFTLRSLNVLEDSLIDDEAIELAENNELVEFETIDDDDDEHDWEEEEDVEGGTLVFEFFVSKF